MTTFDGLVDPHGLIAPVLDHVHSVHDAKKFIRYFAERGQVMVSASGAGMFGTTEMANFLGFMLEANDGVDLRRQYGRVLEGSSGYCAKIDRWVDEPLTVEDELKWHEVLAEQRVAVIDRAEYRLHHGGDAPMRAAWVDFGGSEAST